MDNRVMLKIKLKCLAEEARIIRKEERRHIGGVRESLHNHRVLVVRRVARSTLLAYSYIRGRSYHQVERTCKTQPNWKEVARMVKQYGGGAELDMSWYDPKKKAA